MTESQASSSLTSRYLTSAATFLYLTANFSRTFLLFKFFTKYHFLGIFTMSKLRKISKLSILLLVVILLAGLAENCAGKGIGTRKRTLAEIPKDDIQFALFTR